MVDNALSAVASGGAEVLDGQVLNRYARGGSGKCRIIAVLSVENRTRRADEHISVLCLNLLEFASTKRMCACCKVVRCVCGYIVIQSKIAVVPRRYNDCPTRRRAWSC